jgi:uncharacterized protein (UPF0218 family)
MANKSNVTRLPEEVQKELNKRLGKGEWTLDGLVGYLKAEGFEISRSSLGRYAQSYRREIERMRRVQQVSDIMIAEIGEAAAHSKLGRTVAEMVKIVAFDHLAAREGEPGQGEADPRDLMFIARAIRDAVGAGKIELEQELAIRKAMAKQAADKAVAVAGEEAKKVGQQLPPEALKRIREEIYGIVEKKAA